MPLLHYPPIKRIFTATWLLLYAAAGLIVHAPFGHVHHHHHPHGDASRVVEHIHTGHNHPPGQDHGHHTHSHDAEQHVSVEFNQVADSSSSIPSAPVHEDDCAGCQLLGSVSAPTPVVELLPAERLLLAAPVLVVSLQAANLLGVSLARAPPATV